MGGKPNIKRNKNLFYIAAGLICLMLLSGCQYNYYPKISLETTEGQEGRKILDSAATAAGEKDFPAAFEINKKAYDQFPAQLKPAAIFQKALLHAHPDNPERNFEKAMVCFDLIDTQNSEFVLEYNADLIFSSLKTNCGLARKMVDDQADMEKSKQKIAAGQKKIKELLKEQKKLKSYITRLRGQIKKLKEVDLSAGSEIQEVLDE